MYSCLYNCQPILSDFWWKVEFLLAKNRLQSFNKSGKQNFDWLIFRLYQTIRWQNPKRSGVSTKTAEEFPFIIYSRHQIQRTITEIQNGWKACSVFRSTINMTQKIKTLLSPFTHYYIICTYFCFSYDQGISL